MMMLTKKYAVFNFTCNMSAYSLNLYPSSHTAVNRFLFHLILFTISSNYFYILYMKQLQANRA